MHLSYLRYYQVICEYNNVTRAAEVLHVSQPSLSKVISDMENEFGVTLFYRQRDGLKLTEEGKVLQKESVELLRRADALEEKMKGLGAAKLQVNLGVPPMIGTMILPPVYDHMKKYYPETVLNIVEMGSLESRPKVMEGILDAAIVSADEKEHSYLDYVDIRDACISFYVSIDNKVACLKKLDLDVIRDTPIALLKEGTFLASFTRKIFEKAGLTPDIALQTGQISIIQTLLRQNIAGAFLYEGLLDEDENIVRIPIPDIPAIHMRLIWNKHNYRTAGLEHLIDVVRKMKEF